MDKISVQRALALIAALIAVLVVDDGLGVDALNRPAPPKASLGPPAVERRPLAAHEAARTFPRRASRRRWNLSRRGRERGRGFNVR